mmetsp:Transcript_38338/g.78603  ORF Transcript_38338/g.78603 Transcript_38338/m.78603 type:complete len:101 (-) Transcript_38338:337-639(-)
MQFHWYWLTVMEGSRGNPSGGGPNALQGDLGGLAACSSFPEAFNSFWEIAVLVDRCIKLRDIVCTCSEFRPKQSIFVLEFGMLACHMLHPVFVRICVILQ